MLGKKILVVLIICAINIILITPFSKVFATNKYEQKVTSGIESFPESYKKLLKEFVNTKGHENWNFKAYYTGIDWNEMVSVQGQCGKNRVYSSMDTAHRCSCGNIASGYYCADDKITAYFMDPRNFINERNLYQFLEISYDPNIQTKEIVQRITSKYNLYNKGKAITFKKDGQTVSMTYADIIMDAARKSQMNPISIAIKIVQEVGSEGTSGSVTGANATYPGYYNYFNIGAYDTGNAILNGLEYAKNNGWNTPYKAIVEGAKYNSKNYIQAGQNTAYFNKFDCVGSKTLNVGETQTVNSNELFMHQYMTNIQDPYSQSASLFTTYTNEDLSNKSLSFVIPIYNNMPEHVYKPSTIAQSKQELYYADISSSLIVRTEPTTNSNISATIYKDDLVIMLGKGVAQANGYIWDKVQLWNGKIAYIPDEFLKKFNKVEEPASPTIPPTTANQYGYADVSSYLKIRSGPGTTYSEIGRLEPKEEAMILEESNAWYKIRKSTGFEGYVMKEYFVKKEVVNKTAYRVDKNIINIAENTNISIIAKGLKKSNYIVKDKKGNVVDGNLLGTGYTVDFDSTKRFTIIKKGDVSGDGIVHASDYVLIKNKIMDKIAFDDNQLLAADLNNDKIVHASDYVNIKQYIMGEKGIEI